MEAFLLVHEDLLIATFTNDNTSITPGEVIHAPKRVDRQEEAVYGITVTQRQKVY